MAKLNARQIIGEAPVGLRGEVLQNKSGTMYNV